MRTQAQQQKTPLIVLDNDTEIQALLLRAGRHFPQVAPQDNDLLICRTSDGGYEWIVIRFYHPGDDGYVAFGISEAAPEEQREEAFAEILMELTESAAGKGINAWEHSMLIPETPARFN